MITLPASFLAPSRVRSGVRPGSHTAGLGQVAQPLPGCESCPQCAAPAHDAGAAWSDFSTVASGVLLALKLLGD